MGKAESRQTAQFGVSFSSRIIMREAVGDGFILSKDTDLANLVFRRLCTSIRSTTTYRKREDCHETSASLDQVGSTVQCS